MAVVFRLFSFLCLSQLVFCCKNGGTIIRITPEDARCQCTEKWKGINCTIRHCVYGIIVQDMCFCKIHYTGSTCQERLCENGRLISGRCECFLDWEGEFCHLFKCAHGYRRINSDKCLCELGFTGRYCNKRDTPTTKSKPHLPKTYVVVLLIAVVVIFVVLVDITRWCIQKHCPPNLVRNIRRRAASLWTGENLTPRGTSAPPLSSDDIPPPSYDQAIAMRSRKQVTFGSTIHVPPPEVSLENQSSAVTV